MSDCRFGVSPVNYPDPDPDSDPDPDLAKLVCYRKICRCELNVMVIFIDKYIGRC